MKTSVIATLVSLWGFNAWAGSNANLNSDGVILHGYDAVSYFKADKAQKANPKLEVKPQKGNPKFQVKQDDNIYWFATEENKETFSRDPKKYEPQFGGWCAYAVSESKSKVDVDPESFLIQNDRLLLFYKNWLLGNTREKWLHTKGKDSETYLKDADSNWPETKTTQP